MPRATTASASSEEVESISYQLLAELAGVTNGVIRQRVSDGTIRGGNGQVPMDEAARYIASRKSRIRRLTVANESTRSAYRPDEVAAKVGVSTSTIYSWLKSGKLAGKKVDGTWLISKGAVRKLLPDDDA